MAGQAAALAQDLQRAAGFARIEELKACPFRAIAQAFDDSGELSAIRKEMALAPVVLVRPLARETELWEIAYKNNRWIACLFPEGIEGDKDPLAIVDLNLPEKVEAARLVKTFRETVNR